MATAQHTATPQLDAIIERIKKLQAMTDTSRGTTPAEAATAAAKIQELLFNYNLELAQIDAAPDRDDVQSEEGTYGGGKSETQWRGTLLHHICLTNFCRSVRRTTTNSPVIVGRKHNILVVRQLFDYLAPEILRLANAASRADGLRGPAITAFRRAFALGAVTEIVARLREQRRVNADATAASTALVLASDRAVATKLKELFPRTVTARRASVSWARQGAYAQGREAGRVIGLNRPLDGHAGRLALN
jgi:hypothetical protein